MDIHGHRFMLPELATQFMLAGNARVTLKSSKTGQRFTYRIRQSDDKKVWFVAVLTDQDNESGYTFMGSIRAGTRAFSLGRKTHFTTSAPSYQAFAWAWKHLSGHSLPDQLEVWHEGRCGRCGRALTVPESIESGFGPECIQHVGE